MRRMWLALIFVLVSCMAACGAQDPPRVLVVGLGDTPEQQIAAEIYAQTLQRSGASVQVDPPADRSTRMAELDSAKLTLVVEQTRSLLTYLGVEYTGPAEDDPVADPGEAVQKSLFAQTSAALPAGLSLADYALADVGTEDAPDNLVPLYRTGSLTKAELTAVNRITGELTTAELKTLVGRLETGAGRKSLVSGWLDTRG